MKNVLCKVCAKAEELVKHIPQYVLSNEHIILVFKWAIPVVLDTITNDR